MMRKVQDLGPTEAIHCKTEKECRAICKLMHEAGLKWHNGESYAKERDHIHKGDEIYYFPYLGKFGTRLCMVFCWYDVYPASDFLSDFETGDVVLVSDDKKKWEERIYITTIDGVSHPYITYKDNTKDDENVILGCWKYIKQSKQDTPVRKERKLMMTDEEWAIFLENNDLPQE